MPKLLASVFAHRKDRDKSGLARLLHVLVGLNRSAVVGGMATASEHVASLTSVAVAAILALWPLAEDAGVQTGGSLCSYAECQACSSTWWFPIGHGPVQIPLYLPLVPGWPH